MDTVSIIVFGLSGLACLLVSVLVALVFGGTKTTAKSQFDGKNDTAPQRTVNSLEAGSWLAPRPPLR